MDMTGWLEYFTEGLATQLSEVRQKGERIIRADAIAAQQRLSARQRKALRHLLEHGALTIQEYGKLCPGVSRRTLQRDLAAMVGKGLIASEGSTNRLVYTAKGL